MSKSWGDGFRKGRAKGYGEGLEDGREEGYGVGRKDGREEGYGEGYGKGKITAHLQDAAGAGIILLLVYSVPKGIDWIKEQAKKRRERKQLALLIKQQQMNGIGQQDQHAGTLEDNSDFDSPN